MNDESEKPEPEVLIDERGNKYVIDEDGHEQLILDFEAAE